MSIFKAKLCEKHDGKFDGFVNNDGRVFDNAPNVVNGFDFKKLNITKVYVGLNSSEEWEHYLWTVVIQSDDRKASFTTAYKTGVGHVVRLSNKPGFDKPFVKVPKNSDIIYSLLLDMSADDESFSSWCENYGYNTDSISALTTYNACCAIAKDMRRVFTREQIEAMRTALEDY